MPITVLFDLDETLLKTNLQQFLPAYFQSLGSTLSHLGSIEKITNQMNFAISQMIANKSPKRFLKQIFADNFYSPMGTTESACQEIIDHYYSECFPKLQAETRNVPGATHLVEWCRSQDMILAIATNPLFPEASIRQRILWYGLNPSDFALYTTYDHFHFAKPNLEYYAEILGRFGWPNQQTVMIGDKLKDDIQPTEKMGFKTFWIDPANDYSSGAGGDLAQVKPWLENVRKNQADLELSEDPQISLAVLRSTPAVIETWLRQGKEENLTRQPLNLNGHFAKIIWNLADFETEISKPQWDQLLLNPNHPLPPIKTLDWTINRSYQHGSITKGFAKFFDARLATLKSIQSFHDEGFLNFSSNHAPIKQDNIQNLLAVLAKQDRIHLGNLHNLLNNYKIY